MAIQEKEILKHFEGIRKDIQTMNKEIYEGKADCSNDYEVANLEKQCEESFQSKINDRFKKAISETVDQQHKLLDEAFDFHSFVQSETFDEDLLIGVERANKTKLLEKELETSFEIEEIQGITPFYLGDEFLFKMFYAELKRKSEKNETLKKFTEDLQDHFDIESEKN